VPTFPVPAAVTPWFPRRGVRISRASRPGESGLAIHGLFVFIGAQPRTGWLAGQLAEDSRGCLLTGTGIPAAVLGDQAATPLFLETSRPGILAVGDVRSGSSSAPRIRPSPPPARTRQLLGTTTMSHRGAPDHDDVTSSENGRSRSSSS
jgi:thioredoxin reductase